MKKCKECNEAFEPKNPKGQFCSQSCRQKDYRKKIAELLKGARSEIAKITHDRIDYGVSVYKTTPEGIKRVDPLGDEADTVRRIAELEKEIKNPPKNLQLGTKMYISIREKELKELKSKLP